MDAHINTQPDKKRKIYSRLLFYNHDSYILESDKLFLIHCQYLGFYKNIHTEYLCTLV
jgi:hypothetical protein